MTWQRTVLWILFLGMVFSWIGACAGSPVEQNTASSEQPCAAEPIFNEPEEIKPVMKNSSSSDQPDVTEPILEKPIKIKPVAQKMSSPEQMDTLGLILDEPARFESKIVTVTALFSGWRGPCRNGPPVSRSDWMIADSWKCIYVHGPAPPGFDPSMPTGEKISVTGTVRLKRGQPYLDLGE